MKKITFNKELITNNFNHKKINFEVNPLDVNIAQIQLKLLSRLEREMPEYGDFAPVIEKYESKDPTKNISTIKVVCEHVKDKTNKTTRKITLYVCDKMGTNEYSCQLSEGKKSDIISSINDSKFFDVCKEVVLNVSELLKNS